MCGASYGGYLVWTARPPFGPLAHVLLRAPALSEQQAALDLPLRRLRPSRRMPEAGEFLGALGRYEHDALVVESERDETIPHGIVQCYLDTLAHGQHRVYRRCDPTDLARDDWRAEFRRIIVDWFRPL